MHRRFVVLAMIVSACSAGDRDDGRGSADGIDTFGGGESTSDDPPQETSEGEDDVPPPPATCGDSGWACVPIAPPGWSGPFALYDGDPADAPACDGALSDSLLVANADLQAPTDALCDTCTCAAATGDLCGTVPVTAYAMSEPGTCGGCSAQYFVEDGGCQQGVTACGQALGSIEIGEAPASGGSCVPAQLVPELSELAWSRAAIGCAPATTDVPGCAAEETCMPLAAAPFEQELGCIAQDGDVACPDGWSDRRVFHRDADDQRGCNPCECGPSQGAVCHGSLGLYADDACAQVVVDAYGVPASCTWKSSYTSVHVQLDEAFGGVCEPSGGGPTGTVIASDPVTVCCASAIDPPNEG